MEDRQKYKLGEICNIFTGKKDVNQTTSDGLYPFFSCAPIPYKSPEYIYDGKAIIVAGNGSFTGRVSYYIGKFDLYQRTYACVPTMEFCNFHYLYYYMKAFFEPKYLGGTRGSSIPYIVRGDLADFSVILPSFTEQNKIASILQSIDDKIECNRRINENLEQQAQALFKSWFVDFEPFKDQPFVESELGMIPQGWKVVELGDLVEIIDNRGKTPPLESKDLYPIIDVKALTGPGRVLDYNKCSKYVNHETYTSWFRSGHPKKYDILLSTVGSLAETKLFMGGNGCIAQNVVALRNDYISLFLYDYLNRIKSDLVAYNIGSVQPSIKVTHIIKHKIILPQADVLDKYISLSRKLTENIYNYSYEIDNLSSLRDELLPKLMSGELNVENVNF
jgi:type I restriction enzyme S subunit